MQPPVATSSALASTKRQLPLLLTSLASACSASAAMAARIAGDSLFLQRYSTSALSLMYLLTAVVVAVFAITFGQYARRTALNWLLIRSCAVLAVIGIVLRLLLYSHWPSVRILTYVWADATVAGTSFLFWSLFGQVFDIHEGKQALGIVGGAATLGCILTGFLVRPFTKTFGTSNLLWVVSFLVLAMAALVFALMWAGTQLRGVQQVSRNSGAMPGFRYYLEMLQKPRERTLALHTSIAAFVIILVEFQFKAAAQGRFSGHALAGFFGTFYGAANVVGLLLQLLMVRQLLHGKRLSTSLQVLPFSFALGGLAILLGGWWAIIATRFIGQILQYGVDGAGMQVVFLGIRKQTRPQLRAFTDGICRPIAIAAAAGILAMGSRYLPVSALAVLTSVMAVVWLILARRDYTLYVNDLLEALNSRLLDFTGEHKDLQDRALEEHLRRQLLSVTGEKLQFIANVAAEMKGVDWSPEMYKLLESDREAKLCAFGYFARRPEGVSGALIVNYLSSEDLAVRRAAAFVVSRSLEKVPAVVDLINDPDPYVRASAASAAIRHGSPEEQGLAVQVIFSMVSDEVLENRIALATAAGSLPADYLTRVLKQLLSDTAVEVRCVALNTSGACAHMQLVPLILERVFFRETSDAATAALTNCGREFISYLAALGDRELSFLLLRSERLPGVLASFADERSFAILERAVRAAGKDASSALIQAFCRLARKHMSVGSLSLDSALQVQLETAALWWKVRGGIALTPANELLKRAIRDELDRHIDNALRLMTTRYPDVGLEGVRAHLHGKNAELRSEAVELLEHVLPRDLSRQFSMLLVAETTTSAKNDKNIMELAEAESPESILLGVLEAFAQSGAMLPVKACHPLLRHPSGLVRQATLYCMARTSLDREFVLRECEELAHDEDAQVAHFASSLAKAGGMIPNQKGAMMTVIEKILTLGRVPIFSQLDTTALAHVSSCAVEETFAAGTKIIIEGEYGEHMFIIVDGSVEVITSGVHLANLASGDFVGEMSMLDGGSRSASVLATTDCLLLRIDKDDFEQLLTTYSSAALAVIRTLSKRLRAEVAVSAQA